MCDACLSEKYEDIASAPHNSGGYVLQTATWWCNHHQNLAHELFKYSLSLWTNWGLKLDKMTTSTIELIRLCSGILLMSFRVPVGLQEKLVAR